MSEMARGNEIGQRKSRQMKRKYDIKIQHDITNAMEKIKQEIQAKAQRVRRYEKRSKQYHQNKGFVEDGKKFYRELGKNQIKVEEPPQMEQVEQFWQKIWENEKHHNEIADWIKKEEAKHTLQEE